MGDTIGIICPCHFANKDDYARYISGIQKLGFSVKEGKNLYKNTYGYGASEQERADDFNEMITDTKVKMILFGGGNIGNELLPYIDFEAIAKNPKIICSYSNGTAMLNAIYAQTGLTVYYGQFPGMFANLSDYDYQQFKSHFIDGTASEFQSNSRWKTINDGTCEGILLGGYTTIVAMLLGSKYFSYDSSKKYILFLENHEKFDAPGAVGTHLAYIEQSDLINNISGVIFGHYSKKEVPELFQNLERFGKRHSIPVIYCDDFGHGTNHAILPIGRYAKLDAGKQTMEMSQRVI